ncbi:MAG: glucan 1,4-alpha-glucosidase [Asticcacaulis sp.]
MITRLIASVSLCALLSAAPALAQESNTAHTPNQIVSTDATDGPGEASGWAPATKQGIGASYEAYKNLHYSDTATTGKVSKVWFSLANGVVSETMYGLIHEAQIRDLSLVITGDGWVATEAADTVSHIDYLHKDKAGRPLSPAYRLTNTDKQGRFVIIKDVFTDPDHQTLMLRVTVKALKGPVTPYVVLDPSVANTSGDDTGLANVSRLAAFQGDTALSLRPSLPFQKASVGFTGKDAVADLLKTGKLGELKSATGDKGNIRAVGGFKPVTGSFTFDLALGFGKTVAAADAEAQATLKTGYATVLSRYNGEGKAIGWEDYLASLKELPRLTAQSTDNGKLLYASALMLKVQEDRTYAGALIASLSNPWGETVFAKQSATGYKAVWPRDFYQVAMALAALGDRQTPLAAYHYLPKVQVGAKTPGNSGDGGWFIQKAHVDGTPEWVGVQLDQTAMPILLGWNLNKMGLMSDADLKASWSSMLKPAAKFLKDGGTTNLGWNNNKITPPYTQQERWEEQEGFSPSTTAAIVAGLVAASDIAARSNDAALSAELKTKASEISGNIEKYMVTTAGEIKGGKDTYYLRLSRSTDANAPGVQDERNGRKGMRGDYILDAGFLELVRYGVRRADDKLIAQSLNFIDDETLPQNLRVKYSFRFKGVDGTFPGFRRYGNDGYGEDETTGGNYGVLGTSTPGQRGRVWPIFTGERGHYELAKAALKPGGATAADKANIRSTYVRGMELFANEGLMIPEQVWDGVGVKPAGYETGEGTNSATPLAWSHAEYVKLLRSLADGQVWDRNALTAQTFAK